MKQYRLVIIIAWAKFLFLNAFIFQRVTVLTNFLPGKFSIHRFLRGLKPWNIYLAPADRSLIMAWLITAVLAPACAKIFIFALWPVQGLGTHVTMAEEVPSFVFFSTVSSASALTRANYFCFVGTRASTFADVSGKTCAYLEAFLRSWEGLKPGCVKS